MANKRMSSHPANAFIVALEELGDSDLSSFGLKALRLAALVRRGFTVPNGYCIRVEAYTQFMRQNIPNVLLQEVLDHTINKRLEAAQQSAAEIVERMMLAPVLLPLVEELQSLLAAAPSGSVWAVRSSSLEEDSEAHSYAGLYKTFLNVVGEALLVEKIKSCWASLWSAEAIAYRAKIGKVQTPKMGIILQHMVVGEISGVLFTANPRSGSPTEICLNVTSGLNESVVSGKGTPDFYRLSKVTGEMLEKRGRSPDSKPLKKSLGQLIEIALRLESNLATAK